MPHEVKRRKSKAGTDRVATMRQERRCYKDVKIFYWGDILKRLIDGRRSRMNYMFGGFPSLRTIARCLKHLEAGALGEKKSAVVGNFSHDQTLFIRFSPHA